MKKVVRILGLIALAGVVVGVLVSMAQGSRARKELAKYKAELRARGEKLSIADLGFPRAAQTNDSLPQLLAAADRLGGSRISPGLLERMDGAGAGRARAIWQLSKPSFNDKSAVSWEQFAAEMHACDGPLEIIRTGLQSPPRYFSLTMTNVFNPPRNPFVQKRIMAQWLGAALACDLHEGRLDRAQTNLHALTQLVQLHRDEPTLVNQMIRVAIANLALAATWEALQADGWDERGLSQLQQDWEQVNLLAAIELGMVSERVLGGEGITQLRAQSVLERWRSMQWSSQSKQSPASFEDYFGLCVIMPLWRANMDADELLYLQSLQKVIDGIRKLDHQATGAEVDRELAGSYTELDKILGHPLARVRYRFSAIAIPNSKKATQTAVRAETLRRLTVTAIALERHRLRLNGYPEKLEALVPEFLGAVPIDPMNLRPLTYRRNGDGTFTLYSVGEDGRDDGGVVSTTPTSRFDLWSGPDFIWPIAVTE